MSCVPRARCDSKLESSLNFTPRHKAGQAQWQRPNLDQVRNHQLRLDYLLAFSQFTHDTDFHLQIRLELGLETIFIFAW
jgi:hypothetical protein